MRAFPKSTTSNVGLVRQAVGSGRSHGRRMERQAGVAPVHPRIASSEHHGLVLVSSFVSSWKICRDHFSERHYVIVFKNPRDKTGFRALVLQAFPDCWKQVLHLFDECTQLPYGYIMIDLHPAADDRSQLFSHFTQQDGPTDGTNGYDCSTVFVFACRITYRPLSMEKQSFGVSTRISPIASATRTATTRHRELSEQLTMGEQILSGIGSIRDTTPRTSPVRNGTSAAAVQPLEEYVDWSVLEGLDIEERGNALLAWLLPPG